MKNNNKNICAGLGMVMLGFSTVIDAAEKQEVTLSNTLSKGESVVMRTASTIAQFNGLLSLESNSALEEISKKTREDGSVHYRFRQTYNGVPVYGDHVIITTSKSGSPTFISGSVMRGIQTDLGGGQRRLVSEANALTIAKYHFEKTKGVQSQVYTSNSATLYVELDERQIATFIYKVEFFAVVNGVPTKPIYIINANNGQIIKHYDGLNTAKAGGPGGNQRMGKIEYGQNGFPLIEMTKSGSICVLENDQVRVVDMAGGESEVTSPAVSYYCGSDNYHAEYQDNGNYGYNNDALFGGTSFVKMMSEWYGEAALPFKLIQRTNFSNNYANAYWDGSKMTYGDGGSTFHHMDSFGVVGHEVAHGYTQFHSNLTYNEQSGGINESFSDMAGEALKNYILGSNDFIVGSLLKKNSGFMRNMINPPADGYSIDHVSRYYSGIDVHLSSGVYNKAFYLLATSPGWNTQKAFQVFLIANRDYWRPNATYQSAGSGVCQAAALLGYDGAAVKRALNAVGVTASDCNATPTLPIEIIDSEILTISGGEKENFRYYITVPNGATALTVTTNGNNGDADLYVKFNQDASDSNYDCGSLGETSNELCTVNNPQAGEWRILVHAWAAISNIQLTANVEGAAASYFDVSVSLVGDTGKTQKDASGNMFVRYKAIIENEGPGLAANVILTNILPEGVTLRAITLATGSCTSDGKNCQIGDVGVGTTVEVTIEVGVIDGNSRQFGATVNAGAAGGSVDSNADNNIDAEKFGGSLGMLMIALLTLTIRRRAV